MVEITEVLQTTSFKKKVKKLNANQKSDLDIAVREVISDPEIGEQKKGDLSFLRVHKFKMVKQLTLLGYSYKDGSVILELITLGSHENFYRDVKRK
ncbi:MAG: addiction module toxin RelE [Gammaproteobacteria bacterium]|nr:MAG: addiction module toxin RelE [Gammaproteobacteria bacterium]